MNELLSFAAFYALGWLGAEVVKRMIGRAVRSGRARSQPAPLTWEEIHRRRRAAGLHCPYCGKRLTPEEPLR